MTNPHPSPDRVEELKPCPFCGETNLRVTFSHEAGRWDIWQVECEACCVSKDGALGFVGDDARKSAIAAWNTRPESESVTELIAAVDQTLAGATYVDKGLRYDVEQVIRSAMVGSESVTVMLSYARHKPGCAADHPLRDFPCDCGFSEALTRIGCSE